MKKSLPVFILLVFYQFSFIQTYAATRTQGIKDTIYVNSADEYSVFYANTEYVINSDITIHKDSKLEIQPGTIVRLKNSVRINVYGELIAKGNKDSLIVFTSFDDNPWNCINLQSDYPTSIEYCKFENTLKKDSRSGALHFGYFSQVETISNCTFLNNQSGAIFISNLQNTHDKISFINNSILSSEDFGISLFGGTYNEIVFIKNKIKGKTYSNQEKKRIGCTGIRIGEIYANELVFRENKIERASFYYDQEKKVYNHPGGALLIQPSIPENIKKIHILKDTLSNNESKFSSLTAVCENTIVLDSSTITNNNSVIGGGYLKSNNIKVHATVFQQNKFINSIDSPEAGGGGLTIEPIGEKPSVYINQSKFKENRFVLGNGGGLAINGNGRDCDIISIKGSNFESNKADENGGAIYCSNFRNLHHFVVENSMFSDNRAEIGSVGGGGILLESISNLEQIQIKNSNKIKNNFTNYGNGGFLNLNEIISIGIFDYTNNIHEGISKSFEGNGGLIYSKSETIGKFQFNENAGIRSIAQKSGGAIFLSNNAISDILEVRQNTIDSSLCVEGDGGFLAISNDTTSKVLFKSNVFKSSVSNSGSGGVAFVETKFVDDLSCNLNSVEESKANKGEGGAFYFNLSKCKQVQTNGNALDYSYSKGQGGAFYIQVLDSLESFNHENNTIGYSESHDNGGVLFFKGNFKDDGIIKLMNNTSKKSKSNRDGGYAYIAGMYNNDLIFSQNDIVESDAEKNGGLLFLNFDTESKLNKIVFNNNTIQKSSKAINGKGGILHFNGILKDELEISNNNISECQSDGEGGGFYFINKGTNSFFLKVNHNTIEKAKSFESGGIAYIFGNKVKKVEINNNTISTSSFAKGSGGSFFLSIPIIKELMVEGNDISSSSADNGSGGFWYVNSSAIDSLIIKANNFDGDFSANNYGGIFYLMSDTSKNIYFSDNTFSGSLYAKNGGIIALQSRILRTDNYTSFNNNICKAIINVKNDGGGVFIKGAIDNDFSFSNNVFQSSCMVTNNGGLIYIYNDGGSNESFNFNNNSIRNNVENIAYKAENGGFVFVDGSFQTQKLTFDNNLVLADSMFVNSTGGAFSVTNDSDFKISEINISNNEFANIQAPVKGIIGSFNCKVDSIFSFVQNKISDLTSNQINNSNSYSNGTIHFNNQSNTGLLNLKIDGNEIQHININNDPSDNFSNQNGGGLINYQGNSINHAEIKNNEVSEVKSGVTGIFTFNVDSINSLISSNNYFNNVDAGVGNIYFLTGDNRVALETFETKGDTVKNSTSQNEASYIYINASGINFFELDEVDVFNCFADSSGGAISFSDEILIDSLVIKNSNFSGVSTNGSGGLINLNGDANDFLFTNNDITNYSAGGHGGVINLSVIQKDTIPCILKIENSNFVIEEDTVSGWEFINGNQKWTTEGEGGSIYLKSVDEIDLLNNYFDHSVSLQSGGGIRSIESQKFNLTNCEFVYNKSVNNNGGAVALTKFGIFKARNNKINGNFASQGNGGGYYLDNGLIEITNDSIVFCSAQNGAGIYADMFTGAIDSTCFVRNYAPEVPYILPYKGGALFLSHINSDESFKLTDNKFYRNSSERGGALFLDSSNVISTRQIFAFNSASDRGGAVYVNENSTSSEFFNNIYEFNEVEEEPGILDKASGIQVYAGQKSEDTTKIINCLFLNNYGLAVSITDNSVFNTKARCLIRNSELYFNKYFSEELIQFYDPINILLVDYSNVQDIDVNTYPTNFSISPYYNPEGTICIDENSANKNKGHPGSRYFDICDTTNLRNDVGVTGGPYAFCNCEVIKIKNNNCCITNSDLVANTLGQQIKVYPNPTKGILKLELHPKFDKSYTIKIFGLDGIMHFEKKITNVVNRQIISFNINKLPNGTYLMKVFNTDNSYSSKIVKL